MISKTLIILLALIYLGNKKIEEVLCSHKWKVAYVKMYEGDKFPTGKSKLIMDSDRSNSGQVVSFQTDHSCKAFNKPGSMFWNLIDNYTWSVEGEDVLRFSGNKTVYNSTTVYNIYSFNADSILLYNIGVGIENGRKEISVTKLVDVK
jgi:hypothetical protein